MTTVSSNENINKFLSGSMTLSQLKAYINAPLDSRGQTIADAQKSFTSLFADIASFEGKINSTYRDQQASFGDQIDVVRNSLILDFLCVVNTMCGDGTQYDEYLADFLVNQNKDGSSRFYVPVIVAGFVANDASGTESPTFYSLPDYMEKAYGIPASNLLKLGDNKVGEEQPFGSYTGPSGVDAFENAVYGYLFEDDPAPKKKLKVIHLLKLLLIFHWQQIKVMVLLRLYLTKCLLQVSKACLFC